LSAEGSRVTSLRTPAREQGGAHARRPSCTHEYTPRRAVEGRHAHPAAAMLFEAARKCMRNKLRSVQLLYYVQHLGPVRGVVLTAHARPAWARAAHQNTCHPYSTRGHSACALARCSRAPALRRPVYRACFRANLSASRSMRAVTNALKTSRSSAAGFSGGCPRSTGSDCSSTITRWCKCLRWAWRMWEAGQYAGESEKFEQVRPLAGWTPRSQGGHLKRCVGARVVLRHVRWEGLRLGFGF